MITDKLTISLRPAVESEVEIICRIGADAYGRFLDTPHPELAMDAEIPRPVATAAIAAGRLTVADHHGRLIGWSYVGRLGGDLCLGEICVLADYGRQGVGTQLLGAVIDRARSQNEASLVLATQSDIAWNMPWYAREGFRVVDPARWTGAMRAMAEGQTENGALDWGSRVFMMLELDPV